MPLKFGTLHIFGSRHEHGDAWVCGDRVGLIALRDALNRALNTDTAEGAPVMAKDLEGYTAFVVPLDEPAIEKLALPYGPEWFEHGVHPFELMPHDRYLEITRWVPPEETRYKFVDEVSKEALAALFAPETSSRLNCSLADHVLRQLAYKHMAAGGERNDIVREAIIGPDTDDEDADPECVCGHPHEDHLDHDGFKGPYEVNCSQCACKQHTTA